MIDLKTEPVPACSLRSIFKANSIGRFIFVPFEFFKYTSKFVDCWLERFPCLTKASHRGLLNTWWVQDSYCSVLVAASYLCPCTCKVVPIHQVNKKLCLAKTGIWLEANNSQQAMWASKVWIQVCDDETHSCLLCSKFLYQEWRSIRISGRTLKVLSIWFWLYPTAGSLQNISLKRD